MRTVAPVSPGEMLEEQFLKPLGLTKYRLGLSDGWWLRAQANYDTAIARESMGEALARISRCALLAG